MNARVRGGLATIFLVMGCSITAQPMIWFYNNSDSPVSVRLKDGEGSDMPLSPRSAEESHTRIEMVDVGGAVAWPVKSDEVYDVVVDGDAPWQVRATRERTVVQYDEKGRLLIDTTTLLRVLEQARELPRYKDGRLDEVDGRDRCDFGDTGADDIN